VDGWCDISDGRAALALFGLRYEVGCPLPGYMHLFRAGLRGYEVACGWRCYMAALHPSYFSATRLLLSEEHQYDYFQLDESKSIVDKCNAIKVCC